MLIIRYLLWMLLVLIGLFIVSLNADPVVLNYYQNTISLPLSFFLLFSFTGGWVIGLGLNFISYIKLKTINRRLHQRCQQLETEAIAYSKRQLQQAQPMETKSFESSLAGDSISQEK